MGQLAVRSGGSVRGSDRWDGSQLNPRFGLGCLFLFCFSICGCRMNSNFGTVGFFDVPDSVKLFSEPN